MLKKQEKAWIWTQMSLKSNRIGSCSKHYTQERGAPLKGGMQLPLLYATPCPLVPLSPPFPPSSRLSLRSNDAPGFLGFPKIS